MITVIAMLLAVLLQASAEAGSVAGTVTDAASHAPIPYAHVVLARVDGPLTQSIDIKCDALGRFNSAAIPPGTYRVFAEDPDYVRSEHRTSVSVARGQTVADVSIPLTRFGVITGRVVTEHGNPAPDIYLRAWRGTEMVAETRTNDLGEYRLFGLAPGSYVVSAERYRGPTIGRTSPLAMSERLAQAFGGTERYWVPTPPCPGCRGEGVGSQAVSALLDAGNFLDPRALTGRTYPTVYFPGTTDQTTAAAIDIGAGAEVSGIDLRLIVK